MFILIRHFANGVHFYVHAVRGVGVPSSIFFTLYVVEADKIVGKIN